MLIVALGRFDVVTGSVYCTRVKDEDFDEDDDDGDGPKGHTYGDVDVRFSYCS